MLTSVGLSIELFRHGTADVVVSYAVDRLSRNQNHIGVLFDKAQQVGARLEFVTEKFDDTAIGRFIPAARAFIGDVEREKQQPTPPAALNGPLTWICHSCCAS